jgi:hypothetical protein
VVRFPCRAAGSVPWRERLLTSARTQEARGNAGPSRAACTCLRVPLAWARVRKSCKRLPKRAPSSGLFALAVGPTTSELQTPPSARVLLWLGPRTHTAHGRGRGIALRNSPLGARGNSAAEGLRARPEPHAMDAATGSRLVSFAGAIAEPQAQHEREADDRGHVRCDEDCR